MNDTTGAGNDLITTGLNNLTAVDTNIISSGISDFNASKSTLQSTNDTTISSGTTTTIEAGTNLLLDSVFGNITIDTSSGNNLTLSQGGSSKFSVSGGGASQITAVNGGTVSIGGTTTTVSSTSQPLTLQTTSGGRVDIKCNNTTQTGINIENTNTTSGGITIKTNGTSGDINLTSDDDIILTSTALIGRIDLNANVVAVSQRIYVVDKPLISFALTLYPEDYNTTNSQLLVGYPDANTANVNNNIRFPYNVRVAGWSVSGDTEAHASTTLRLRIGNNLGGAINLYLNQVGTLATNALQNNSATVSILGASYNMTSISTDVNSTIPAGTRVFFYENTSVNMACEMIFTVFFSQVA